jgi:MoaA/NifB/PqqE/SkfB family radical SAM enzyme
MNSIAHAAERKAVQTVVARMLKKGTQEDAQSMTESLMKLIKSVMGESYPDSFYQLFEDIAANPDSKWGHYVQRILDNCDPKIVENILVNAAYEGGWRGYKTSVELSAKYDTNIPWIVLFDPTSACNLHCTGCWAAEYGYQQNLSWDIMDKIVREGRELGVHAYLLTGGEPTMRKADLFKLCAKYPDCEFHAFTNGTLIDDEFCENMLKVGNFIVSLSLEGFEEATDSRRGKGTYQRVVKAMDRMKSYKIPFGLSICYTSKNYKDVTSDEFLDFCIEHGAYFLWYFHYMPVGMNASTDLLLTPEQRMYMKDRVRWIRGLTEGKEIYAIDFQNDGEYTGGCVAGGKRYLHINAAGDVEPCVFIHYSGANIKEKSLLECLQQPLFMEYRRHMPFNDNYLRPCPMLENPHYIREMVQRSGAHSTDLEAAESTEHLTAKTEPYAEAWAPVADKYWKETYSNGREPKKAEN